MSVGVQRQILHTMIILSNTHEIMPVGFRLHLPFHSCLNLQDSSLAVIFYCREKSASAGIPITRIYVLLGLDTGMALCLYMQWHNRINFIGPRSKRKLPQCV